MQMQSDGGSDRAAEMSVPGVRSGLVDPDTAHWCESRPAEVGPLRCR
jgi:hypothetical protein